MDDIDFSLVELQLGIDVDGSIAAQKVLRVTISNIFTTRWRWFSTFGRCFNRFGNRIIAIANLAAFSFGEKSVLVSLAGDFRLIVFSVCGLSAICISFIGVECAASCNEKDYLKIGIR